MNKTAFFLAASVFASAAVQAQVTVADPWVRATVAPQTTTAAYMTIASLFQGGKLVEVRSPLAASAEVHEMKMDGDVMRMGAVAALPLPMGQPVALKPGGYHLMLTGLNAPVKVGEVVPITLVIEDAQGKRHTVPVKAVARQ